MELTKKFKIDFFELSFLAEACIQPTPIARHSFWMDLINIYYHEMSKDERVRLWEWIKLNPKYNIENKDNMLFEYRFNPIFQFKITTNYNNKIEEHDVFLMNGSYYTSSNSNLQEKYIIKIEKS